MSTVPNAPVSLWTFSNGEFLWNKRYSKEVDKLLQPLRPALVPHADAPPNTLDCSKLVMDDVLGFARHVHDVLALRGPRHLFTPEIIIDYGQDAAARALVCTLLFPISKYYVHCTDDTVWSAVHDAALKLDALTKEVAATLGSSSTQYKSISTHLAQRSVAQRVHRWNEEQPVPHNEMDTSLFIVGNLHHAPSYIESVLDINGMLQSIITHGEQYGDVKTSDIVAVEPAVEQLVSSTKAAVSEKAVVFGVDAASRTPPVPCNEWFLRSRPSEMDAQVRYVLFMCPPDIVSNPDEFDEIMYSHCTPWMYMSDLCKGHATSQLKGHCLLEAVVDLNTTWAVHHSDETKTRLHLPSLLFRRSVVSASNAQPLSVLYNDQAETWLKDESKNNDGVPVPWLVPSIQLSKSDEYNMAIEQPARFLTQDTASKPADAPSTAFSASAFASLYHRTEERLQTLSAPLVTGALDHDSTMCLRSDDRILVYGHEFSHSAADCVAAGINAVHQLLDALPDKETPAAPHVLWFNYGIAQEALFAQGLESNRNWTGRISKKSAKVRASKQTQHTVLCYNKQAMQVQRAAVYSAGGVITHKKYRKRLPLLTSSWAHRLEYSSTLESARLLMFVPPAVQSTADSKAEYEAQRASLYESAFLECFSDNTREQGKKTKLKPILNTSSASVVCAFLNNYDMDDEASEIMLRGVFAATQYLELPKKRPLLFFLARSVAADRVQRVLETLKDKHRTRWTADRTFDYTPIGGKYVDTLRYVTKKKYMYVSDWHAMASLWPIQPFPRPTPVVSTDAMLAWQLQFERLQKKRSTKALGPAVAATVKLSANDLSAVVPLDATVTSVVEHEAEHADYTVSPVIVGSKKAAARSKSKRVKKQHDLLNKTDTLLDLLLERRNITIGAMNELLASPEVQQDEVLRTHYLDAIKEAESTYEADKTAIERAAQRWTSGEREADTSPVRMICLARPIATSAKTVDDAPSSTTDQIHVSVNEQPTALQEQTAEKGHSSRLLELYTNLLSAQTGAQHRVWLVALEADLNTMLALTPSPYTDKSQKLLKATKQLLKRKLEQLIDPEVAMYSTYREELDQMTLGVVYNDLYTRNIKHLLNQLAAGDLHEEELGTLAEEIQTNISQEMAHWNSACSGGVRLLSDRQRSIHAQFERVMENLETVYTLELSAHTQGAETADATPPLILNHIFSLWNPERHNMEVPLANLKRHYTRNIRPLTDSFTQLACTQLRIGANSAMLALRACLNVLFDDLRSQTYRVRLDNLEALSVAADTDGTPSFVALMARTKMHDILRDNTMRVVEDIHVWREHAAETVAVSEELRTDEDQTDSALDLRFAASPDYVVLQELSRKIWRLNLDPLVKDQDVVVVHTPMRSGEPQDAPAGSDAEHEEQRTQEAVLDATSKHTNELANAMRKYIQSVSRSMVVSYADPYGSDTDDEEDEDTDDETHDSDAQQDDEASPPPAPLTEEQLAQMNEEVPGPIFDLIFRHIVKGAVESTDSKAVQGLPMELYEDMDDIDPAEFRSLRKEKKPAILIALLDMRDKDIHFAKLIRLHYWDAAMRHMDMGRVAPIVYRGMSAAKLQKFSIDKEDAKSKLEQVELSTPDYMIYLYERLYDWCRVPERRNVQPYKDMAEFLKYVVEGIESDIGARRRYVEQQRRKVRRGKTNGRANTLSPQELLRLQERVYLLIHGTSSNDSAFKALEDKMHDAVDVMNALVSDIAADVTTYMTQSVLHYLLSIIHTTQDDEPFAGEVQSVRPTHLSTAEILQLVLQTLPPSTVMFYDKASPERQLFSHDHFEQYRKYLNITSSPMRWPTESVGISVWKRLERLANDLSELQNVTAMWSPDADAVRATMLDSLVLHVGQVMRENDLSLNYDAVTDIVRAQVTRLENSIGSVAQVLVSQFVCHMTVAWVGARNHPPSNTYLNMQIAQASTSLVHDAAEELRRHTGCDASSLAERMLQYRREDDLVLGAYNSQELAKYNSGSAEHKEARAFFESSTAERRRLWSNIAHIDDTLQAHMPWADARYLVRWAYAYVMHTCEQHRSRDIVKVRNMIHECSGAEVSSTTLRLLSYTAPRADRRATCEYLSWATTLLQSMVNVLQWGFSINVSKNKNSSLPLPFIAWQESVKQTCLHDIVSRMGFLLCTYAMKDIFGATFDTWAFQKASDRHSDIRGMLDWRKAGDNKENKFVVCSGIFSAAWPVHAGPTLPENVRNMHLLQVDNLATVPMEVLASITTPGRMDDAERDRSIEAMNLLNNSVVIVDINDDESSDEDSEYDASSSESDIQVYDTTSDSGSSSVIDVDASDGASNSSTDSRPAPPPLVVVDINNTPPSVSVTPGPRVMIPRRKTPITRTPKRPLEDTMTPGQPSGEPLSKRPTDQLSSPMQMLAVSDKNMITVTPAALLAHHIPPVVDHNAQTSIAAQLVETNTVPPAVQLDLALKSIRQDLDILKNATLGGSMPAHLSREQVLSGLSLASSSSVSSINAATESVWHKDSADFKRYLTTDPSLSAAASLVDVFGDYLFEQAIDDVGEAFFDALANDSVIRSAVAAKRMTVSDMRMLREYAKRYLEKLSKL